MNWKPIAFCAAFASASVATAAPQGLFQVRNDTRQVMSCGLQRAHGSVNDLFVVRPGAVWTHPADGTTPRLLQCDVNELPLRARIHPGVDYVLGENSRGMVVLTVASAR